MDHSSTPVLQARLNAAWRNPWLIWGLAAAVLGIMATVLLVTNQFVLNLLAFTCAQALFAVSINVMLSWVGEVALGQSVFYGIGAYGTAIGVTRYETSASLAMLSAILVAVGLSVVIGAATLRLRGSYFAIVSWGLTGVAGVVALNLPSLTGGPLGLFGIPPLTFGPISLGNAQAYFAVCAGVLAGCVSGLVLIRNSRFGWSLDGIRQNPHLARSAGLDLSRVRLKAFVLSAPIAAAGGALTVPFSQIVTPEIFGVHNTVDGLLIVLLGGSGAAAGPVLGAAIYGVLPYALDIDPNVKILAFSVLIIILMIFVPGGLVQLAGGITARLGRRVQR